MEVTIKHVQKKTGKVRKFTHHGVAVRVKFNAEEKAIIQERNLEPDVVMRRDHSSDLSQTEIDKTERPNFFVILWALIRGQGARHLPHLTIAKLLAGTDVFYMQRVAHAKEYEADLAEKLKELKGWIEGNADLVTETSKFEI